MITVFAVIVAMVVLIAGGFGLRRASQQVAETNRAAIALTARVDALETAQADQAVALAHMGTTLTHQHEELLEILGRVADAVGVK